MDYQVRTSNNPVKDLEVHDEYLRLRTDLKKEPEYHLWSGVLYQAIKDLHSTQYCESVINWIKSDRSSIGSFSFVCMVLDINYLYVRRMLYETQGKRLKKCKGKGDGHFD